MATQDTNQHEQHNSVLGGIGSVGHGLAEATLAGMSAVGHLADFAESSARWVGDRAERGLSVLTGSDDDYNYWDKQAQANADVAQSDLRQAGQDLFGADESPSASDAQDTNGVSNTMDASALWPSDDTQGYLTDTQGDQGNSQVDPADTQDYADDNQNDTSDTEDGAVDAQDEGTDTQDDDPDMQDDDPDTQDDDEDTEDDPDNDPYGSGENEGDPSETQDDTGDPQDGAGDTQDGSAEDGGEEADVS